MIDIIHQHLKLYDEIVLLTGFLNPRNNELDGRVKVHMLKSYDRANLFNRSWSWIVFTLQVYRLLLTKYQKSALYLVSNPPLTVFLERLFNRPTSFLIYDVYPDALVEYDFSGKDSFLVKWWEKINRKAFKNARHIFTISPGMKKLLAKYVDEDKIEMVPVWTDNKFLQPVSKPENPWVQKHGLQEDLVVMYSGNLGITHPLELLMDIAEKLNDSAVKFVIVGEGKKKELLANKIKDMQLKNVLLLPYQPMKVFPYSLAAADIGVVILDSQASNLSVPSKTYNLMSVGVPILAIADHDSDLADLIEKHENGVCYTARELEKIVAFIKEMLQDRSKLQELGGNSIQASKEYGSKNAEKMVFSAHV